MEKVQHDMGYQKIPEPSKPEVSGHKVSTMKCRDKLLTMIVLTMQKNIWSVCYLVSGADSLLSAPKLNSLVTDKVQCWLG